MAETMGLSGCYAVIKYYMMVVNIIFLGLGIAVLFRSVWVLLDPNFRLHMAHLGVNFHTAISIILTMALLMFIIGGLGYLGAYRESPCMLMSFFCFLLIIVAAEIAFFVLLHSGNVTLQDALESSVRSLVQEEYGTEDKSTAMFDAIQKELHCCGVTGPRDWADSKYNMAGKDTLGVTLSSLVQVYHIPKSCCRDVLDDFLCRRAVEARVGAQVSDVIYSEGCFNKLVDVLNHYMRIINGVGIGIGVIECISLLCSLILCCRIRIMYNYKVLSNAWSKENVQGAGGLHSVSLAVEDLHKAAVKHEQDKPYKW